MDTYSRDTRRHKRSLEEISQSTIDSPSHINTRESTSTDNLSLQQQPTSSTIELAPISDRQSALDTQNIPSQRGQQEMTENSQSRLRLQHETPTSHAVIDLTNDTNDVAPLRRVSSGSQWPHIVGSNSSISSGDFVDLTGDQDQEEGDEIIVTGQRRVVLRQNGSRSGHRLPLINSSQNSIRSNSPLFIPSNSIIPVGPNSFHFAAAIRNGDRGLAVDLSRFGQIITPHNLENIPTIVHLGTLQSMSNRRDFGRSSFGRTPSYVPPPAARENFTRSPTSSDIIICPSCEEELVHKKGESITKKGGKVSSKKDREEHPFWVVKECGHVYCNRCYQNRGDKARTTSFREEIKPSATKSNTKKSLTCAVSDCKCDVKGKDKWVGVFL